MLTVSDTSPISNLASVGRLNLLHDLYHDVWIPEAVRGELLRISDAAVREEIARAIRGEWLKVRAANNTSLIHLLTGELDAGEAEAIALALQLEASCLLLDEREGRTLAKQLDLRVVGVLGILLRAKAKGMLPAVKPEIDALRAKAHFFISRDLETKVLATAGELP